MDVKNIKLNTPYYLVDIEAEIVREISVIYVQHIDKNVRIMYYPEFTEHIITFSQFERTVFFTYKEAADKLQKFFADDDDPLYRPHISQKPPEEAEGTPFMGYNWYANKKRKL